MHAHTVSDKDEGVKKLSESVEIIGAEKLEHVFSCKQDEQLIGKLVEKSKHVSHPVLFLTWLYLSAAAGPISASIGWSDDEGQSLGA